MIALAITDLAKTYQTGVKALNGISLTVNEGDFFALLGPNGAGKSTTIGILCSLVNKTSGTVKIFGEDIDINFPKAKSYLGVMPQEFNFSIFETAEQIVANQAGYFGFPPKIAKERAHEALKKVGLWEKRKSEGRFLSGGMKRRLMIARALVHDPKLLILDEPTAGVDVEVRHLMWDFLLQANSDGLTIILTTHYLEEAERLCKNLAIIDRGDIVQRGDIKMLLGQLKTQHFILDLTNAMTTALIVPDFLVTVVDPYTIEVALTPDQTLNDLFAALNNAAIPIAGIRSKINRLEELFLRMTHNGDGAV